MSGRGPLRRETEVRERSKGKSKDLTVREGIRQRQHPNTLFPANLLTFFTPLFPGTVNVVLELDADLPLCGLVSDEGKLE